MTIEQLKEISERVNKNNEQLKQDIASMQNDRKEKEADIRVRATIVIMQILETLSLIPVGFRENVSGVFDYNGYRVEYLGFTRAVSCTFIPERIGFDEDAAWKVKHDFTFVEDCVRLINYYYKEGGKECLLEDVKDAIIRYNDELIEEARKECDKSAAYVSALTDDTDPTSDTNAD